METTNNKLPTEDLSLIEQIDARLKHYNLISEPEYIKPPLGIIPRKFWLEQRLTNLDEAIERYNEAQKEVPQGWYAERNDIKDELGIVEPKEVVNEVEQERWKPNFGEEYWYVPSDLIVSSITNRNDSIDKSIIKSGNCFKTKEEAYKLQEEIKQYLSNK